MPIYAQRYAKWNKFDVPVTVLYVYLEVFICYYYDDDHDMLYGERI